VATQLEARLERARATSGDSDPFVHYERAACFLLVNAGFATQSDSIHASSEIRWAAWAADAILFSIDALRAGRANEALRGWGQVRECQGRNGGFLPVGLSDAASALQNALEKLLRDLGDRS